MALATSYSRAALGIDAPLVTVETQLAPGLPMFNIVGLPETAVKESRDRVRAALINSRYEFPAGRITVNLAPADLPKEGGRFDLAIAIGILAASGQLPEALIAGHEFLGELALSGEIRAVHGVLPCALACRDAGRCLALPRDNAQEAALVSDLSLRPSLHLLELVQSLIEQQAPETVSGSAQAPRLAVPCLSDVRGQPQARRALEVAAAGRHSLLLVGPPGAGKTMLASRLPGILPPMTEAEALATAAIQSISNNGFDARSWRQRPFRAPHHTASAVALVGGGSKPRPGEISLAHNGVLFLDELPEFDRKTLEVLREPLENGHITISRATRQASFPARFQLMAAMNPCPCGWLGDPQRACGVCTREQIQRYRGRISGPVLDRIDLQLEVAAVPASALRGTGPAEETSDTVRDRVERAHAIQLKRAGHANAALSPSEVERDCALSEADYRLLEQAVQRLGLSARGWHRILRVARTIADLAAAEQIGQPHLLEAISYRSLERRH